MNIHRSKLLLSAWRVITLIYAFGRRMPVVFVILLCRNLAAVVEALAQVAGAVLRTPVFFIDAYCRLGAIKRAIEKIETSAASVRVERN